MSLSLNRTCLAALLTVFVTTSTAMLVAQIQPRAFYPLLTDLNDATGLNGAVSLLGNPPPAAPNGGVCMNGVYRFSGQSNWQEIQTPNIANLNTNDMEIYVEFNLAVLPTSAFPVILGGNGWRWLGINVRNDGAIGVLHNNSNSVYSTTTTVTPGTWYAAELKYQNGMAELYIDGALALQSTIGPLTTSGNHNFSPTNYSNGQTFNGCIRNLLIADNTTLGTPIAFEYGAGCAPTTGRPAPEIGWRGPALVGNADFAITLENAGPSMPAFLVAGLARASIPQGACTQLVLPPLVTLNFGFADPSGARDVVLPLPNNASLVGLDLFFQWLVLDPNGQIFGQLLLSDAASVKLQ